MTHMSTGVAGTKGYVAPEYALYGQLTDRSDVFSFGVVLLELFSGKKALHVENDGQPSALTDLAWSLVRYGETLDVIEDGMPELGPTEVLEKYVLVVVQCCHPQLYARPTMDQGVKMLETEEVEQPISCIAGRTDIDEKSVAKLNMAIKEDVEDRTQKGIREPLVVGEQNHHANKGHPWMVYFSTFIAVCGSYEFGACAGYSSPTQDAIRKDLSLSLAEYSLFGSILTFGAMVGAITSGPLADFIGRKGAMRVSSAFCVAGWLVIYFSEGPVPLDIGRLATGYGMGVFSYVVPVFVAEIAPKELRGALTTLNQFMIVTAVSVSFIIGNVLSWRALAIIGLVPTAVLLLGLFFIPESPRWLAKRGHKKDFVAALQILRGKDADISEEAEEIQIGIGLMVCQQFGGINGICFYASSIFEQAGFSPTIGTITYACLQIVITGLGAAFIDKAGRKPLLLASPKHKTLSGSGLVAGCIFAAVAFYLKVHEVGVEAVPALAVTGILVYIGSFSIGMGAIPWVVMSEIFPVNVKGLAGSVATLTNWFGAWLCSYTFNFLMSWSSYGTFILYAAINALAILFIIVAVPETKGKSLEQLQADINS
ncbi:Sugar transporter ERD6-like 7 isoform B [Glycine soja]|uniref:Sugar transporter ERD6-like 7 isoform B n=1 Tax=Glycine soja TaxID=3848 RepID=A0A445LC14_GLYSO|nr:Sugar transporter ERD6-like 7 isoform B [Glycine soja]